MRYFSPEQEELFGKAFQTACARAVNSYRETCDPDMNQRKILNQICSGEWGLRSMQSTTVSVRELGRALLDELETLGFRPQ